MCVCAKLYVVARMHTERVRCSNVKSPTELDDSACGEAVPLSDKIKDIWGHE